MLRNYLKISFRLLWKNKVHTAINVCGLGLGIACCVLIALFVQDEWTYDTFHTKSERIYRAYLQETYGENEVFLNTVTPFPLGPVLADNLQEIEAQVRLTPLAPLIKVGENQFADPVLIAGSDFFRVFDFEGTKGPWEEALLEQN